MRSLAKRRWKTEIHLLLFLVEETCETLDGVGALLVDVVARVATLQALDRSLEEEVALRSLLACVGSLLYLLLEVGSGSLKWAVLDVVAVEDGQLDGAANTVVCTKCCTSLSLLGTQNLDAG